MKTVKTAMASLALATFLMGQSAYAATRSFDSLPSSGVQAPASIERASATFGAGEQLGKDADGLSLIILLFGSAAAFVAFLEAVGAINIIGDDDSPGG